MVALMIKTIIVLLNFAFKLLWLVNETRTIGLMQADKQANHLASATKFLCVCHKNGVLEKHPIRENNTYLCFH